MEEAEDTQEDPDNEVHALQQLIRRGASFSLALSLRHGADPNGRLPDGTPLLHAAVKAGSDWGAVAHLLRAGAQVDVLDQHGQTPLQLSYRAGTAGITRWLWMKKADTSFIGEPTLARAFLAASTDELDKLQQAVATGLSVHSRDALDCPLLLRAALSGATSCVLWLLEQGADIEALWQENTGYDELTGGPRYQRSTPLCLAAEANHLLCVSALLRAGARVEPEGVDRSPLCCALDGIPGMNAPSPGREALTGLLLSHGADWRTYAHWERLQAEHLPMLLAHGLAENQQILKTIFGEALYSHNEAVTSLLRQHGYRITLWEAVLLRDVRALKAFLDQGADVNAFNDRGFSPLWLAVMDAELYPEARSLAVIDLLLEAGADPLAPSQHSGSYFHGSLLQFSERDKKPHSVVKRLRDSVDQHGAER